MAVGELIDACMREAVPGFSRARDLEESRAVRCYENVAEHRLLRFEFGRPKGQVWIIAFEYIGRPSLAELLNRGLPNSALRGAEIGPLPLRGRNEAGRLRRLLGHYVQRYDLLEFDDPFLSAFLDALVADPADIELAQGAIRRKLSDSVLALRGDVPRSEILLPFGRLFVEQDPGYVSRFGKVPAFARLALDEQNRGTPFEWFKVDTVSFLPDMYVSPRTREQLIQDLFVEARRNFHEGQSWIIAENEERSIVLCKDAGRLQLRPSKEYVLHLNRERGAFTKLLQRLDGDDWRLVYEGLAAAADPLEVLEQQVRNAPNDFEPYRALAEHYDEKGDKARSNMTLGLGYLRARRLPAIARGKLALAAQMDPTCPGLSEALSELESFARRGS